MLSHATKLWLPQRVVPNDILAKPSSGCPRYFESAQATERVGPTALVRAFAGPLGETYQTWRHHSPNSSEGSWENGDIVCLSISPPGSRVFSMTLLRTQFTAIQSLLCAARGK